MVDKNSAIMAICYRDWLVKMISYSTLALLLAVPTHGNGGVDRCGDTMCDKLGYQAFLACSGYLHTTLNENDFLANEWLPDGSGIVTRQFGNGYQTNWAKNNMTQMQNCNADMSKATLEYNCKMCAALNTGLAKNKFGYRVKLNQFATTVEDDFLDSMMNNPIDLAENWRECRSDIPSMNGEIPDSINWVEKGAVTSVKHQQNCISSWAFSAVGVMEAYRVIKLNETLTTLSAQNLIDCTKNKNFGNDGCYGGDMIDAFNYVREKGINTESAYPYVGKRPNECLHERSHSIENLARDFRCIPEGDEQKLKAIVANFGPVAVTVDARRWTFRFYDSGIYHDDKCCNLKHCLNHPMLVVGYGTEAGVDYWLVKNSFGETWGEKGYMKIARNYNNTCGIATAGLYAV